VRGVRRRLTTRRQRFGDWYSDVDMSTGYPTRPIFDSLQAFWPGLLALNGDIDKAVRTLNSFLSVWRDNQVSPAALRGSIQLRHNTRLRG
jgi:hypothetical protein